MWGERMSAGPLINYNNSLATYTTIGDILGKISEMFNDVMSDI